MSSFRIRPRFKHLVREDQHAVEQKILSALQVEMPVCESDFRSGYINLRIPQSEIHYWSPQLTLTFESTEEGTVIRGLYGPAPNVWTLFFFGYAAVGVLSLVIGMWGFARYSLGLGAGILWLLPVLGGVGAALYLIAQFGQKLGAEQMYRLHHFYESLIHDKIAIS